MNVMIATLIALGYQLVENEDQLYAVAKLTSNTRYPIWVDSRLDDFEDYRNEFPFYARFVQWNDHNTLEFEVLKLQSLIARVEDL